MAFRSRVSGHGLRVSGSGFGLLFLGFGFQSSGFGFQSSGFGFRVSGPGFRVSGSGFRVSVFGFRVQGLARQKSGFKLSSGRNLKQVNGRVGNGGAPLDARHPARPANQAHAPLRSSGIDR